MTLGAPHGGLLVNRIASPAEAEDLRAGASRLPHVRLSPRSLADLECIATGAYSPMDGFMTRLDYEAVVEELRLASGDVWSLPVTLPIPDEAARASRLALTDERDNVIAILDVADTWRPDREREARLVFGTDDLAHPGVRALADSPETYAGGRVTVLGLPHDRPFAEYRLTPAQSREIIADRGWRTVVGFQTRNPVHRAHEHLQKVALEIVDGLLLHPLVGETKDDDVPAAVRMRCYETLLSRYYPLDRTMLAVYPAAMRYAGPREAIVHALSRKNYGCTHFIVGRDHAGVGSYYGTFAAQEIFDRFAPDELGIEILRFEHAFWCRACGGMATAKTCPHPAENHVTLSGTRVRAMLDAREIPPAEFTRPEVAHVLIEEYRKEQTA